MERRQSWHGSRVGCEVQPQRQVFRTTDLGTHLTRGFQTLWQNQQLFDCTIQVDDKSFELHKGLLIALSPYFQSMFTSGFEEAGKSRVELKGITAAGFSAVSQFLYTAEISICEQSLQDIMEAAAHLQVPGVLDFCGQFIAAHISTSNCFDFFKLAHVYDHVPSLRAIVEFIARNCHIMAEKPDFQNLPPAVLAEVLQSEHLPYKSELEVLKVAVSWLAHKSNCDIQHALRVFESVRYALISPMDVERCMDRCFLKDKDEFKSLLVKAFSFQTDPINLPRQIPKAQYRRAQYAHPGVMLVHDSVHDVDADVITGHVTLGRAQGQFETCETLDSLPGSVIFKSSAITELGGFVFVSGGELEPRPFQGFHASAKTHRFDFLSKHWVQVQDMNEARGMHGMAAIGEDKLLVVGGLVEHEALPRKITSSVEIYDIKENIWTQVHDFHYKVRNIEACSLRGQVYAAGGTSEVHLVSDFNSHRLHRYDAQKDNWTELSSMNCKKIGHVLMACNDKIFACGGYLESLFELHHEPLSSGLIECYSPDSNQWTIMSSPLNLRNMMNRDLLGGFVIGNSIFLLGRNRLAEMNTDTYHCRLKEVDGSSVGLCVAVQVPYAVTCHGARSSVLEEEDQNMVTVAGDRAY